MTRHHDLKQRLLETDSEFRSLYEAHRTYERRLDEMLREPSATTEEEIELKSIKIEKLRLKDRMESMLRDRRSTSAP
jgi:uncharacterized protein YdcH (DUF465 family)